MKKPEIPENEEARLLALEQYDILDSLPEQAYDDITAIAAEICGTPIALISLIDEKRQWFKSHHGLDVSETPREFAYCAHAINDPQNLLEVKDANLDERFQGNPLLTGSPYVRYYAGSPLISADGHALGTLCVIDHKPHQLTSGQKKALEALSRQVVLLFESRLVEKDLKLTQFSFQNSRAGIAWVTEDAKVVKYNDRYAELTGYSAKDLADKRIFDFDPNFDEVKWRTHWKEMAVKKSMAIETEFFGENKTGRWVELNLKFLNFQDKEYILAICVDITDGVQSRTREHEIMKGLKALVKEKDDLIGLFSHDMKSPINQVKGLGQIMSLSLDDKEILKESLAKLDQTANRQLTLYKNILYMLKADQIVSEDKDAKKLPLLPVIKKAIKSLAWETDAKNITSKISIPESIEVYIHLNLFVQAIQNLLSNAIKFSHAGSEVRIKASENDNHILLTIEDDGIGFDQDKETALFNRFTKEGRRGTNNEASTGLGLYLVKKIVENHHGTIRATSKGEGKGSSFIIQLPKVADF